MFTQGNNAEAAMEVFLKISQISQKNTCARVSFLIKLQVSCLQYFY